MKIDKSIFDQLITDGLVNVQKHPTDDLYIYNYSQKAQFLGSWTPELKMCRGLILDESGNVIARPFDKFFNYEQHLGENSLGDIPMCAFKAYDKLDGSLGILYKDQSGKYCLATRGSFISDQAMVGTKMLQEFLKTHIIEDRYTYLFEIIYPENRIVVDYGGVSKLVPLAMRNIESGQIIPLCESVEDYQTPRDNAEGVVLYYENGFLCKIKYEEYKRLHRLVTGVNAKTIWELLKAEQPFDELLERVPDEFYQWVKNTTKELQTAYNTILDQVQSDCWKVKDLPTRKDQAIWLQQNSKYLSAVFAMLDGKNYQESIWKLVRPRADRPFREDES